MFKLNYIDMPSENFNMKMIHTDDGSFRLLWMNLPVTF